MDTMANGEDLDDIPHEAAFQRSFTVRASEKEI